MRRTPLRVLLPAVFATVLLMHAGSAASAGFLSLFRRGPSPGAGIAVGTVRDSVTGKPVAAAAVWVRREGGVAWTDMKGGFRLDSLGASTYTFFVEATGYRGARTTIKVPDSGEVRLALLLTPAKVARPAGIRSPEAPVLLCGTVVNRFSHKPVQGAAVSLRGRIEQDLRTQRDGVYGFVAERVNKCTLAVHHEEYHDTTVAITVPHGGGMRVRDVELYPVAAVGDTAGTICGRVVDSVTGEPLGQAAVKLLNTHHFVTADSAGRFVLGPLSPGTYSLVTTVDGYESHLEFGVALKPGDTLRLQATMAPHSAARTATAQLSGTVIGGDSVPREGITVAIRDLERTVMTDSEGMFSFDSLVPNLYLVEAREEGNKEPWVSHVFVEHDTTIVLRLTPSRSSAAGEQRPPREPVRGAAISGMVVDSSTGSPVAGAHVRVDRSPRVAVTDRNGAYRVEGLRPRDYRLRVTVDGYVERLTAPVSIEKRQGHVRKDVLVVPSDVVQLDRYVVRSTAMKNTAAALLQRRKKTISISDGIAGDEMSRAGASNAADALKLVTGVAIIDGKFVNIRGLSGRYSTVLLDGVRLPSSEPDRHAVSLDIFPAGLLDNIKVAKTWSPDMPADFAGGTVDLTTASFPEKLSAKAKVSIGYREEVTGRTMICDEPASLDWLGFDDGTRDVPDELRGRRVDVPNVDSRMYMDSTINDEGEVEYFFGEYNDREWEKMHEELDEMSESFETGFVPHEMTARPDIGLGFSVGNTFTLFDRPLGLFGAITYGNSNSYSAEGKKVQRKLKGHDSLATVLDSLTSFVDEKGTNKVSWSGLTNAGYKLSKNHTIDGLYMYSRIAENTAHSMYSTYHYQTTQGNPRFFRNELMYRQRGLHIGVVNGAHTFSVLTNPRIDWYAGVSHSFQHEPDHRVTSILRTVSVSSENGDTLRDTSYMIPMAFGSAVNPQHRYRYVTENGREAGIDLTVPCGSLPWNWEEQIRVRGGYSYRYKDRDYFHNGFELREAGGAVSLDSVQGDLERYTAEYNLGVTGRDSAAGRYDKGLIVFPKTDTTVNHVGHLESQGVYGMVELPLLRFFTLVGGLRREATVMSIDSWKEGDSLYEGQLDTSTLHVGVQGITKLPRDMQVRAGFSNTAVLPIFREKAPYAAYDMALEYWLKGNPDLRASHINNYDMRWEWFPGAGELLAVGAFYKEIQDLIVKGYSEIENSEITFRNIDEPATIAGLEFEVRKRLGFLAPWLKGLAAGGNLVLLHSRWHVDEQKEEQLKALASDPQLYRPLPGASPYVVNALLKYDNRDRGFSVGAYFNVFGKRLDFMTADHTPDVYEYPRPWLTVTMAQKFGKGLKVKVKGKNLFDSVHMTGHEFLGEDYIRDRHATGRSFSVSCAYSFQ